MNFKFSMKDFARMFVRTRNGAETAVRLGVRPEEARRAEADLLSRQAVQNEIRRLDSGDQQSLCYVKTGLSRLAFGAVNDAVALAFDDEPEAERIMRADLFNVAEIKRPKGGGIEMKFFDRQKALEKLVELDPQLREVSAAEAFLEAFYRQAQDIDGAEDADEREAD